MANAADSKSAVLTGLWVRVPPSVPKRILWTAGSRPWRWSILGSAFRRNRRRPRGAGAATLGAHGASERIPRAAGRVDPAGVVALGAVGGGHRADAIPRVGGGRGLSHRGAGPAAQAGARRAPCPGGELDVGAGALDARRRDHRAAAVARPARAVAPVPGRQGGAGRAASVARGGPPGAEGGAAPVGGAARARQGRRRRPARRDREGRREEPRLAGSGSAGERAAAPQPAAAGRARRRARGAAGSTCRRRTRRPRCTRRPRRSSARGAAGSAQWRRTRGASARWRRRARGAGRRGGYFAATSRSRPSIRCIKNRSVGPNAGAIRRRSSR
ncbi:uncharacterized protein SOCE26_104710 [Sorangium cellulosum]|uniref:Uncharacterized protein n=1 Tax=Sorangium cellulosum TaxID=56 RepID=A0A2L0FBP8_SORCE|nr:uncharacterized protein SOCE26_104710 [Sorangium cellulosum]